MEKENKTLMPVLFIGHGSPMNAIEKNEFSNKWANIAKDLPRPKLVLCISAHWQTKGSYVTGMQSPKTIHDFYGFPPELSNMIYPANGDVLFADKVTSERIDINNDQDWGLDHGTWSILCHMYPDADIPIVQLSIDHTKSLREHFEFAKTLEALRENGVLIVGSGNVVHNLRMMYMNSEDINDELGYDWALEINNIVKDKVQNRNFEDLLSLKEIHPRIQLGVPTLEHYIPLLYVLGMSRKSDRIDIFNDKVIAGSLSMTSFIFDTQK